MPVIRLREMGFEPKAWFYNPNIHPLSEYLRRREAAGECAGRLSLDIEYDDRWDLTEWLVRQLPNARSQYRCEACCGMRLEAAAKAAAMQGVKHFTTSLLYSRYQPHEYIRKKGTELAEASGLEFVYADFREDWQEGIDRSREWGIYRQAWCGCIFSESERYAKKLSRLRKI